MQTLNINLKFHRPEDRLPQTEGWHQVIVNNGLSRHLEELHYSPKHQRFNCWDSNPSPEHAIRVEWWAERPGCLTH